MPESGTSMLRRLFLSPVTMASYSPEHLQHGQAGSELSTAWMVVRPESAQTSAIGISLACLIKDIG